MDGRDEKMKDLHVREMGKRAKRKSEIGEFVKSWCKPSPFLYTALVNLTGPEKLDLCIPCINWFRRCSQGMKKRSGGDKQMLLVDQMIQYMIEPGSIIQPDQRCMWRLLKIFKYSEQTGDLPAWYEVVPMPVKVMLSRISGEKILAYTGNTMDPDAPELLRRACKEGRVVFDEMVRVWWEYNGRTRFFLHQRTARLVRKYIKDHEVSSDAVSGEPGFGDDSELTDAALLLSELEAAIGSNGDGERGRGEVAIDGAAVCGGDEEKCPESASVIHSDANGF